ncbi:hypothetical protein QBC47DRAFT_403717 [Echria macrotheca]|uniref:Uncharacterized protein n=1 Tax=Echria macrotheca TaxID=438768 RepID=A0AAJ0F9Q3_9PEZI|nr:hypothetical protein QBC47DRAFT_403717 [Echria macrotheca]
MAPSTTKKGKRGAPEMDSDSSPTVQIKRAKTEIKKKKEKKTQARHSMTPVIDSPIPFNLNKKPVDTPKAAEATIKKPAETPKAAEPADNKSTGAPKVPDGPRAIEINVGNRTEVSEEVVKKMLETVRGDIARLDQRRRTDELRAIYRHEILFNALKKVSEDLNGLKQAYTASRNESGDQVENSAVKAKPTPHKDARHTMELCLNRYVESLNKATEPNDIKINGELCLTYADRLFRTYIQ